MPVRFGPTTEVVAPVLANNASTDDLYSGYETRAPSNVDGGGLFSRAGAPASAAGRTLLGSRMGTARTLMTGGNRQGTSYRPQTSSNQAAGYTAPRTAAAGGTRAGTASPVRKSVFDPLNQQGGDGLNKQAAVSLAEQIKAGERRVAALVAESMQLAHGREHAAALAKAKDAAKRERALKTRREMLKSASGGSEAKPDSAGDAGSGDIAASAAATPAPAENLDLTFSVLLNLATQYENNAQAAEAIATYTLIIKNRNFHSSARLRVNVGNLHFAQREYAQAIKNYRMALDHVSAENGAVRARIMANMAIALCRQQKYAEAVTAFEAVMDESATHQTGLHLMLCYFALGDKDKIRAGFQRLLEVPLPHTVSVDDDDDDDDDDDSTQGNGGHMGGRVADRHVFKMDALRSLHFERRMEAERCVTLSASLAAPIVEASFSLGFDWVMELVRASPAADLADQLEIVKANQLLLGADFLRAVESLRSFEKRATKFQSTASTILSFLYFLQGENAQARKAADRAIAADKYNAYAYTNRGNTFLAARDAEEARSCYQDAITVDSGLSDAVFNLGLLYKGERAFPEAKACFEKLHYLLKDSADVIYQLADVNEMMGAFAAAIDWFNVLLTLNPTDPSVLKRIGLLIAQVHGNTQAFHHFSESYRYFPNDLQVLSWLGAYYTDCHAYEQAALIYERAHGVSGAAEYKLKTASAYRKCGSLQLALSIGRALHEEEPANSACLDELVKLCTDLGQMQEATLYASKRAALGDDVSEQQQQQNNKQAKSVAQPSKPAIVKDDTIGDVQIDAILPDY